MSVEEDLRNALQLAEQRRFEEAAALFAQVIEQRPDWPEGHYNYARAMRDCGRIDKAINAYTRAIDLRPDYGAAWHNLANIYFQLNRNTEAADAYAHVTAADPNDADAWFYQGIALLRLNLPERAARALGSAVALNPGNPGAQQQFAFASHAIGQIDDAERAYERFLQLMPNDPSATYSLGLIRLARGDYARGWPAYEMRRSLPGKPTMRRWAQPEWDGGSLDGRTILLHAEQGLGDTLQFIRFAPRLTALGARVILVCPSPLVRLLENQLGIQQVVADGTPIPPFDVQVPMMSLAKIFEATPQTVASAEPYLRPRAEDVDEFRDVTSGAEMKIGLCWGGNPANTMDAFRSLPLGSLAPVAEVPGIRLFSLQVGRAAAQVTAAGFPIVDLREQLSDFCKTAALIDRLDLTITVETAVAHLSGAMGKPTWLLTSFATDWRWMLDRRDSPWYPSVRLFRQPVLHDWDSVVCEVVRELKEKRWNS